MRKMLFMTCLALCCALGGTAGAADDELIDAYRVIAGHTFVDLTHAFDPGIAHWPGFPKETVRTLYAMKDVRAWEARHGMIPQGAFIAMRTDWAKRWPSEAAMENKDAKGIAHSDRSLRFRQQSARRGAHAHTLYKP